MNLSWRATVASSVLLLFCVAAMGQSSAVKSGNELTISFYNQPLEKVLDEITRKTGIGFVYSANNIDPNQLISFTAAQQPLDEILRSLGHQINLSFKWFDDHVVVKKIQTMSGPVSITDHVRKINKTGKQELEEIADDFVNRFDSLVIQASAEYDYQQETESPPFSFSTLSTNDKVSTRYKLDSVILSSLSLRHQNKNRAFSFFTSFGLYVNDHTYTGLEIRAGTRSLHGIFNASITNNNLQRVGYGLGTFFSSSSNHWIFSLDYNLSRLKKTNDVVIDGSHFRILMKDAIELTSTHHQVKLQANVSLSPNVSLRFGPSINILNTRYNFSDQEISASTDLLIFRPFRPPLTVDLYQYLRATNTIIPPYTIFNSYSPDLYLNTKLWVGIEAGFNYRINFYATK
jgi:hypothetical protein